MHPLATLFQPWFHHLGRLVQGWAGRPHADQPAWLFLNNYLLRTQSRLLHLIAQWRAGTLPAPRPRPATPRPERPPSPRRPGARAWMIKRAGHHAAAYMSQLQHILDQPDTRQFLAEVPRAARLLRPLAHLLGLAPLPAAIARPARAKTPREKPPRPPKPPPLNLPANIRAAARALKRLYPEKPTPA